MELAAEPVEEFEDGYTARPFPAGKTEFSRREIMEFAEFAVRNLIAIPYVEKDRVVLVPVVMGREFDYLIGLRDNYSEDTWISLDFEGNVAVNISRRDYFNYRDDLAFDQLCESLGNLFIEFLDLFRRGYGIRIIDRLDAVGIGPFS